MNGIRCIAQAGLGTGGSPCTGAVFLIAPFASMAAPQRVGSADLNGDGVDGIILGSPSLEVAGAVPAGEASILLGQTGDAFVDMVSGLPGLSATGGGVEGGGVVIVPGGGS